MHNIAFDLEISGLLLIIWSHAWKCHIVNKFLHSTLNLLFNIFYGKDRNKAFIFG